MAAAGARPDAAEGPELPPPPADIPTEYPAHLPRAWRGDGGGGTAPAAAEPGRELFICPEQIAGAYYLSVFGDRWQDTQAVKREIDKAWKRQLRKWKPPQCKR